MAWEISIALFSSTFASHRPRSGEIPGVSACTCCSLASWGLQLENSAADICSIPRLIMFVKGHGNMHLVAGTLLVFQYLSVFFGWPSFLFIYAPTIQGPAKLVIVRICLTTSFWAKKWKVSLHADRLLAAACELPCLKWWGVCVILFSLIAFSWLFFRCSLSPQKLFTSTLLCINKYAFKWMFCLLYIMAN